MSTPSTEKKKGSSPSPSSSSTRSEAEDILRFTEMYMRMSAAERKELKDHAERIIAMRDQNKELDQMINSLKIKGAPKNAARLAFVAAAVDNTPIVTKFGILINIINVYEASMSEAKTPDISNQGYKISCIAVICSGTCSKERNLELLDALLDGHQIMQEHEKAESFKWLKENNILVPTTQPTAIATSTATSS